MILPGALMALGLSFAAGALTTLQAAVNARLGAQLGGSLWAVFASFLTGLVVLSVLLVFVRKPVAWEHIAQTPLWMWTGGVMGAFVVFSLLFSVGQLGAAVTIAMVLAGQMICAALMDHYGLLVVPHALTPLRIGGMMCLALGVWMIFKG